MNDDLTAQEHYRAFAVAGAMKADLLKDLHGAVERAVVDRTTLADFRAEFRAIVLPGNRVTSKKVQP